MSDETDGTDETGILRRPLAFIVLGVVTLFEALQWYTSFHSRLFAGLERIPMILFGWFILLMTIVGVTIAELRGHRRDGRALIEGVSRPYAGRGQIFAGIGLIIGLNVLWVWIWSK